MSSHKRLRVIGSILAVLVLLALAIQWGVRSYLKPRITALLQDIIVQGSDSLYRFGQGSCAIDLWTGTLALEDCHLTLDSNRYAIRRKAGDLPSLTVNMRLQEIKVSGLKVWTWLFHKRVECTRLTLVGAEVSLYRHPGRKGKTPLKELYPLIQPSLRSIGVGEILIGDLKVAYDNGDSSRPFRWAFQRCDLRLRDILVDSTTVSDSTRIAYARSFTIGMQHVSLLVGEELYRLTLADLTYDFASREAVLHDFSVQPVLDAQAFYKKVGHQTDRYMVHIDQTRLAGLNIATLLQDNFLQADSVYLKKPEVHIFRDRTLPPSGRSKMGNYPNQLLLKAPLDMLIRRIRVEGGRISYGEKDPSTQEVGTLAFDDVRGLLTNVTNMPGAIASDPWWKVDLRASFLGQSPIVALFLFDMRDPSGRFVVDATLKDLDAPALDPVTRALAQASVRSFHLRQLETHITGDERSARGVVHLLYDHLHLDLLRSDSGNLSKKTLLTFLVNEWLVHPDNPSVGKPERTAQAVHARDVQKSFFNLIWKTLFAGVRQIVLKVHVRK